MKTKVTVIQTKGEGEEVSSDESGGLELRNVTLTVGLARQGAGQ